MTDRTWLCGFCGCELKGVWIIYDDPKGRPVAEACGHCHDLYTTTGWLNEAGRKRLEEVRDE